MGEKVICAMSGGVDSSVAAALLKKNGYDVIGLFLVMGNNQRAKDAKKVAKKLNIPLKILDVRKEFKKKVVDYLVEEYRKGNTPNPCVVCNQWIKFRFLLKKMLALNADYVASGHYARKSEARSPKSETNSKGPNHPKPTKIQNSKLRTAKDKQKDQTYFLWTLTQDQLKHVLFPIGDYTKEEVRAMARKWELPVYEKKESQEICFVNTNIYKFLKSRIHANKGPIITTNGEKVGEHEGLYLYTIGQRKGIKIGGIGPASTRRPSLGGPFYVVDKDFKNNALIVAQSDFSEALYKKEMRVGGVNWTRLDSQRPASTRGERADARQGFRCKVKIRYLTPAVPGIISRIITNKGTNKYKYLVKFDKKQRAITPGQSAVFYKKNEVLGGGIIM